MLLGSSQAVRQWTLNPSSKVRSLPPQPKKNYTRFGSRIRTGRSELAYQCVASVDESVLIAFSAAPYSIAQAMLENPSSPAKRKKLYYKKRERALSQSPLFVAAAWLTRSPSGRARRRCSRAVRPARRPTSVERPHLR